jgi:chromosome segregation ATPase
MAEGEGGVAGLEAGQRGVAGLEPEPEPELPVDMPPPPPAVDAFRPRSMGGEEVGVRDVGKDWLIQAGFDPPPPPVYGGPPKPAGDPILYKDLNRTRAIMRGQRKVNDLESQRRALELQQQALTVDYSTSLIEVEEELIEVRNSRLDEVVTLSQHVDKLQDEIERRKEADDAVAQERAERSLEAARLRKNLEQAEKTQQAIEREGQVKVRELEFVRDGLSKERADLAEQLQVARTSESEARHRAERAEAEAAALREEQKKDKWELRKTKDMCKNLQAHSQTADEIRREKHLVQVDLDNAKATAANAASEAVARERDLLEKLHTAREEAKRDREIAEVRQEEIVRQRDQLREKEIVITELAKVNATLEEQESRLETLLEERERILMNSAVAEVNRLKEALRDITGSRDKLRQELQASVDKMEMFQKKMAAQEDLVRKAAYTNVSYGKRLEDLTMGLKQKHSDVTAAKRLQVAAEEKADDLRIQLGKTEREFEMHKADSVDAQVHKVTVREKEQAEKRMHRLGDEIRTLRRDMAFNSGQYEGVIERLDSELASVKEKLDTKIAEEAEALKHGGTAMQKLKMQVEALELKKRELHAIARSAEKKCKAAEQQANDMQMQQKALETDARRAKHACAHAEEERARAEIAEKEAKEQLYNAVREADARGAQTRTELEYVKEELQKLEQQKTMVVQLLGLLRRLHNRQSEQPMAEELQDYATYLDIDLGVDPDLLWIAEEAFFAPLPDHYVTHRDGMGDVYYFNTATNDSSYCHPMDNLFRKIALQFGSSRQVE